MPVIEASFLAAFTIGLAGAGHCLGMCGGIMSAISFGSEHQTKLQQWLYPIHYNIGRISAYCCLTIILATFFHYSLALYSDLLIPLRSFAGGLLILMGLYLLGVTHWILYIEKLGRRNWEWIQPIARKLLPINSYKQALMAGFVWGWLPCGLVYSSLIWVSSTGSVLDSVELMFAFGLGTMPAMLIVGGFSQQFRKIWSHFQFNKVSGLFLVMYGVWTLPITQHWIH